jgi:hypothetical protein
MQNEKSENSEEHQYSRKGMEDHMNFRTHNIYKYSRKHEFRQNSRGLSSYIFPFLHWNNKDFSILIFIILFKTRSDVCQFVLRVSNFVLPSLPCVQKTAPPDCKKNCAKDGKLKLLFLP